MFTECQLTFSLSTDRISGAIHM